MMNMFNNVLNNMFNNFNNYLLHAKISLKQTINNLFLISKQNQHKFIVNYHQLQYMIINNNYIFQIM